MKLELFLFSTWILNSVCSMLLCRKCTQFDITGGPMSSLWDTKPGCTTVDIKTFTCKKIIFPPTKMKRNIQPPLLCVIQQNKWKAKALCMQMKFYFSSLLIPHISCKLCCRPAAAVLLLSNRSACSQQGWLKAAVGQLFADVYRLIIEDW